jgi:hypothetical protein
MDDYLSKPMTVDALEKALVTWVRPSPAAQRER